MAKHTPGPWYSRNGRSPHFQGQVASESTGATIAISYSDEDGANARLIAAAPELLDGCNAALAYLADPPSEFKENRKAAVAIIRAAIAKATS
jgi:hypothetical protein